MFDAQWDLKGFDRVIAKMQNLPVEIRGKAGRSALGRAVRVVTNAAKQNAQKIDDPETAEVIAKNIAQQFATKYQKSTGDLMYRVGVRGGVFGKLNGDSTGVYGSKFTVKTRKRGAISSGPGGDTRHWGYVELGTETAQANPFLLPALVQNIRAVETKFAAELEAAIDKVVKANS